MENQTGQKFTTSFIPKKPVAVPNVGYTKSSSGISVVALLGVFIFLGTLVGAVGVYLWKIQVEKTIDDQIARLEEAKNSFNDDTISAATKLNDRIIALQRLLDTHKSPSATLALLEETVLATIGFKNLAYTTEANDAIRLKGSGNAKGFSSIILQSKGMGETGVLKDVIFTDTQTIEGGLVSFTLNTTLDEKVVLYKNKFNNQFSGETSDNSATSTAPEGENIFNRNLYNN
jgi:hypothetical protein